MVKALGLEPRLRETQLGSTPLVVANFLESYPFPDTHTAFKWPCFQKIEGEEMSMDEVKELFDKNEEDVREHVDDWRKQIEILLVFKLYDDKGFSGRQFSKGFKG
jgi:hypothetical protein